MADALAEQRKRAEEARLKASGQTLDALKAQREFMIGKHIEALQQEQAADSNMLSIVVQAALRVTGLPADVEAFAVKSEQLAARISTARRARDYAQMKTLLDGLNAREPNDVLIAAAKRVGVELSVASEAAKLVAG